MIERIRTLIASLPVAHRVVAGAGVAVSLLAVFAFLSWASTPTYSVLYADLPERDVSEVLTQLDTLGVPYRLERGGSTVMVPRANLFDTRARLAGEGIASSVAPQGYERLDNQGLTISDFRQRVDFKIAVEGELAKTLQSMDAIDSATIHLAIPEDDLFREAEDAVTASVLVDPNRSLGPAEIETITFLVSSAVEGLDANHVTVATVDGNVLSAPGDGAGASASSVTDRNLRMTREYEAALASDITRILNTAVGMGRTSVVVNVDLDFDQRETESETFTPESQVAIRENTVSEDYAGTGAGIGGIVGVDGGTLDGGTTDSETTYTREERTSEFGVDRLITRSRSAPGEVERLSVAVVMDDGSLSGITVPATEEVQALVAAGIGLDPSRGDTIRVTSVAFPEAVEEPEVAAASPLGGILALVPQVFGVLVVIAIAVALFLASRRKDDEEDPLAQLLPVLTAPDGEPDRLSLPARQPVAVGAGAPAAVEAGDSGASVAELVERQPEEIADLLRTWLTEADA